MSCARSNTGTEVKAMALVTDLEGRSRCLSQYSHYVGASAFEPSPRASVYEGTVWRERSDGYLGTAFTVIAFADRPAVALRLEAATMGPAYWTVVRSAPDPRSLVRSVSRLREAWDKNPRPDLRLCTITSRDRRHACLASIADQIVFHDASPRAYDAVYINGVTKRRMSLGEVVLTFDTLPLVAFRDVTHTWHVLPSPLRTITSVTRMLAARFS
jgi:phage terminase large subunit-like protein